jgi:hypothetical protein
MTSKHPRKSAYTKKIIELSDHGLYCGKTPQIPRPKIIVPFEKLSLPRKLNTVEHSLSHLDRWVTRKEHSTKKTFEGKLQAKRDFLQEIRPIQSHIAQIKEEIASLADQGDQRAYNKILEGLLWEKEVITTLFEQGLQINTTDILNKCLQTISSV